MNNLLLICFIGVLCKTSISVSSLAMQWEQVFTESCSSQPIVTTILHIRADRNHSKLTISCFDQFSPNKEGSCSLNNFNVVIHDVPDVIHLVCDCGLITGVDCFNKMVKPGENSVFCVTGSKNATMCASNQLCRGIRSGCVDAASCEDIFNECHGYYAKPNDCCCDRSFCNGWFENASPTTTPPPEPFSNIIVIIIFCSVIVFSLICVLTWLFFRYKHRKLPAYAQNHSPGNEENISLIGGKISSEERPPALNFATIEKLEMLSKGQRGTRSVYTAKCDGNVFAVKYFLLSDYASWDAELKIYSLPLMNHDNLLKFIGHTEGGIGPDGPSDHAIFTEYMPLGSLQDVLRQRTVSWDELLHISSGMMCGLAYLHAAIPSSDASKAKPPIAHRDFKSRNVLLKEDLTACVADFGLALPFDSGRRTSNCGQVGTLRYMAPEVLDLAVNFSCEAFLRIDVYACGLTLWEILKRCSKPPELTANSVYEQPFEEELDQYYPHCKNHPTSSEMQDMVYSRRLRPRLPPSSTVSQHLYDMIVTIDQCWDHDSEARPSAGCVYNRIKRIQQNLRYVSSGDSYLQVNTSSSVKSHNSPSQPIKTDAQPPDRLDVTIKANSSVKHNGTNGTNGIFDIPT